MMKTKKKNWSNKIQGKRQPHMTKPFYSTKLCGFQAANEVNDGMYVCFIMSCPADALGNWNINRWRALPA